MNKDLKDSQLPEELTFHYLKTSSYRTFHVDGAYGGLCPNGNIYMELFVERMPTPKQETFVLNPDGKLGPELNREGKQGMIREIESGIVMDVITAIRLRDWLSEKIDQANLKHR
jgi:hypothetical protein